MIRNQIPQRHQPSACSLRVEVLEERWLLSAMTSSWVQFSQWGPPPDPLHGPVGVPGDYRPALAGIPEYSNSSTEGLFTAAMEAGPATLTSFLLNPTFATAERRAVDKLFGYFERATSPDFDWKPFDKAVAYLGKVLAHNPGEASELHTVFQALSSVANEPGGPITQLRTSAGPRFLQTVNTIENAVRARLPADSMLVLESSEKNGDTAVLLINAFSIKNGPTDAFARPEPHGPDPRRLDAPRGEELTAVLRTAPDSVRNEVEAPLVQSINFEISALENEITAQPREKQPPPTLPELAGLLGDILHIDPSALEQGMEQFLANVESVGGQTAQDVAGSAWPGLLIASVAAGVLVMECARRRLRQQALEIASGAIDEESTWSWLAHDAVRERDDKP